MFCEVYPDNLNPCHTNFQTSVTARNVHLCIEYAISLALFTAPDDAPEPPGIIDLRQYSRAETVSAGWVSTAVLPLTVHSPNWFGSPLSETEDSHPGWMQHQALPFPSWVLCALSMI